MSSSKQNQSKVISRKSTTTNANNKKQPEVSIVSFDFQDVSHEAVNLLAKVCIRNPYQVPVRITEITFSLKSASRVIASGNILSAKGNDNTMLEVAIKVPHLVLAKQIGELVSNWKFDILLEMCIVIDLPITGNTPFPLTLKGDMKLPNYFDMCKQKLFAQLW